jgi:hypothetical protein
MPYLTEKSATDALAPSETTRAEAPQRPTRQTTGRFATSLGVHPLGLLALVIAFGLFAACESPTAMDDAPAAAPAQASTTSTADAALTSEVLYADAVVVEADGTMRPIAPGEEGFEVAAASANKVAALITGSATFSHSSVPELRLNVRQTEDGTTRGSGRITLYSWYTKSHHTTDFTAVCVKPMSYWGRTNYGVTIELAEPFAMYGGLAYTHVALGITPDGQLENGVVMNTRAFCGGSMSYYPPDNRLSGGIEIVTPGQ